jgi:hypothetical protein
VYATEQAANEAFLAKKGIMLRTRKPRQHDVSSYNAYAAGSEYGEGISLNRQVGGNKQEHRRLK